MVIVNYSFSYLLWFLASSCTLFSSVPWPVPRVSCVVLHGRSYRGGPGGTGRGGSVRGVWVFPGEERRSGHVDS